MDCEIIKKISVVMMAKHSQMLEAVLRAFEWNAPTLLVVTTALNWEVSNLRINDDKHKQTIEFDCQAFFDANDVEGIIAPFYTNVHVSACWKKKNTNYDVEHSFSGCFVATKSNPNRYHNMKDVYETFRLGKPIFDISEIITAEFQAEVNEKLGEGKGGLGNE